MTLPALRTYPGPHAERAQAFWAAVGNAPAAMTRSGSVRLVDLKKRCLPSGRLIPQHFLEHVPARIQDGLGHLGLGEFGTAHVTDDDQFILTRNPGGRDVQMVFARIGDLGVDRSDTLFVSGSLRLTQSVCVFPIMLERGNRGSVATGGQRFQAKIDTDLAGSSLLRLNFTLKDNVPATASILREATGLNGAGKFTVLPKAEDVSFVCDAGVFDLNGSTSERNPSKAFTGAKASAELGRVTAGISGSYECGASYSHRVGVNTKLLGSSSAEINKVENAEPLGTRSSLKLAFRLPVRLAKVIPDKVYRPPVGIQMPGRERVFHSVFEG